MKFCDIGLGRTGTRSLCRAMHDLGFFANHGFKHLSEEERRQNIAKILKGEVDLPLYDQYDYVGNTAILHWRALASEYPEMKFILTVRDVNEWYQRCHDKWSRVFAKRRKVAMANGIPTQKILSAAIKFAVYNCLDLNEKLWKAGFERYNEEAQRILGDRVLVMNVFDGDGWDKLCEFVSRPVPDVPFPNSRRACNSARIQARLERRAR